MVPGEIFPLNSDIIINKDKPTFTIKVLNCGDRPVQVGSHIHFFEVNRFLEFDRKSIYGMRLNIPAGTAIRFEPKEIKTVELVEIGGKRKVMGANNLVNGYLAENKEVAMVKLNALLKGEK